MRISAVLLLLALQALYAGPMSGLIHEALTRSDSLKAIEMRLRAADAWIARSDNLEDPDLSVTLGDIRLDRPADRSLEPMQFAALNLMQKFPAPGMLDAKRERSEAKKALLFGTLREARAALAERVRSSVATLRQLERTKKILKRYRGLVKKTIALNAAYTATDSRRHMGIMSASLLLSKIDIRLQKITAKQRSQSAYLHYLTGIKIDRLPPLPTPKKPRPFAWYREKLSENPAWRVAVLQTDLKKRETKIKKLSRRIAPYVRGGYYYRNGFPDYLSLSVGAKLPLYGSQRLEAEAAAKEAIAASLRQSDLRRKIESDLADTHARLERAYRTYRILHDRSLPEIRHMFGLSRARIRSGGDLFAYIDLLIRKLTLEERMAEAEADYLRALAHLKNLTGEIE